MRLAAALAACLLSAPAMAEQARTTIAPSGAEPVSRAFDLLGDVDRYRVKLTRGRDYTISGQSRGSGLITLRDPKGRQVASVPTYIEQEDGREFRAAVTGYYLIDVKATDPAEVGSYILRISSDCRLGPATLCQLKPGTTQQRAFGFMADQDWHRLSLQAGRNYTLTVDWPYDSIAEFVDAKGRALVPSYGETVSFRPSRSGTYYARAILNDDGGGSYRIGLAEAR